MFNIHCDDVKWTSETFVIIQIYREHNTFTVYFSHKQLSMGNLICAPGSFYGWNTKNPPRERVMKSLEPFIRYDWMRNQSFCYHKLATLSLTQVLTTFGVCFSFNSEGNFLKQNA